MFRSKRWDAAVADESFTQLMAIPLSAHARRQARRRGIPTDVAEHVASMPEQVVPVRPGREARQRRELDPASGRLYLVRVIVDVDGSDTEVVTVYRMSKVAKYWRAS